VTLQSLLPLLLDVEALGDQMEVFGKVYGARVAAVKVFHLIDNTSLAARRNDTNTTPAGNIRCLIEFKNVKVSYPSRPDIKAC